MIVERVELHRFGRFLERVQVGPLQRGLNILSAPNEQGKSTLVRALARALFDRHTTKADEIRSLQPVGTDLAPEVAVEFQTASGRFQLRKRFLHQPNSTLAEWAGDRWRELATGDLADQRVFEMLASVQPGRGASKPEHWGLLRYLWARQEEPALWPEWQGPAGERVRRCLAKVEMDPGIDRVIAGLAQEADLVFTPTGQIKRGGELFPLQQRIESLESDSRSLQARLQEIESQQQNYRQLSLELAQVRTLAATSRSEAERLREQLQQLELTRKEISAAQEQFDRADAQLQAVVADAQRRAALQKELDQSCADLEGVRKTLKGLAEQQGKAQAELHQSEQQIAELDEASRKAGQAASRLRNLIRWRELEAQINGNRAKLATISRLTGELAARQQQRASLPKVTAKQIENLRVLERQVRDLEVQLHTAGLTLELMPDQAAQVRAETEQGVQELEISPSEPKVLRAHRRARIELRGWGTLAVVSGAAEVQKLEEQLRKAGAELTQAREAIGISTIEEAEHAYEAGRDLEHEIKGVEKQLKSLLDEHDSPQSFRNSLVATEARFASLTAQLEPIEPDERQSATLDLEERLLKAEALAKDLEQRRLQAVARQHNLADRVKVLLRELAETQTRAADLNSQMERAAAQSSTLQQRYTQGIESARQAAQQAFVQAEARLVVSKSKLPAEADALPRRRERAVRAAVEAEQAYEAKSAELNRIEGGLATAAADGLFSRVTELAETLANERARAAQLRRRAQAARFLSALIQRRKAAAVRTLLAPLEQRLSASFADLTGQSDRSVFLDENLCVLGVGRSRDPREWVLFESLSQGAKEQLLLCLRAAAALELSGAEPQLLILDDVLVNTDPMRQTRVLDFLTTLAERVQVLVLTCHPERYAGVGHPLSISPAPATG